ncbi:2-oxoacid:acceptor oxidoreductase family protein [Porcipelethomonas sp.]|uniref:2-oxoacid:acceptor oxidoreductase family protein n=1 Tax=Porcipelethomonas sp. TaxID=2981675 RepID=UPI003EF4543A
MTEIIWLGRGGQGAFTAAKLLGAAYTLKGDGYHGLAFPSFGPERRGAPVRAFTKLDSKPVSDRSVTQKADYIVVLDETLYSSDLHEQLSPGGRIIINSKESTDENTISFDGNKSAKALRLPTVNTVMLGAVSAISGIVSQKELIDAIDRYMPEKIREKNRQAVLDASEEAAR